MSTSTPTTVAVPGIENPKLVATTKLLYLPAFISTAKPTPNVELFTAAADNEELPHKSVGPPYVSIPSVVLHAPTCDRSTPFLTPFANKNTS